MAGCTCITENIVRRRKEGGLSSFREAISGRWKCTYQHISYEWLCGCCPASEVGIDIERYGVRVRRVVSRFVRPDEEKTMNQGDEVYVLLLHWSAKETLFKVMGVEGVDFIRHLHIFPFVMEEEGCLEAQEYRTEEQWHYRVRYLTHPDFVLTWTIKKMPT